MQNIRAEIVMTSANLAEDIAVLTERLGFRMDEIFPADDPRDALITGHGTRLRLRRGEVGAGILRILADDPVLIAGGETRIDLPGGGMVEIAALAPPLETPVPKAAFVVRRIADEAPWVVGRAGMEYRDLIPDRLGGTIIASHIRIPDEGPVPDMVHFHSVGFQLIFCYKGWVDLVYEDQGAPFRLHAGNCVIQPPEIRHRVLFASAGLEVIEIGVPAEHITTIDHQMALPTGVFDPDRRWSGQRFVHNQAEGATWDAHEMSGYEARDTGIAQNTGNVAGVKVLRPDATPPDFGKHDADILFSFVMSGEMVLESHDHAPKALTAGDAFVIPRDMQVRYGQPSVDLELLEVALPGRKQT